MTRQKRMLDNFASHLSKEAEKESLGASGEPWGALGDPQSLLIDECPADNLRHSAGGSGVAGVPPSVPHTHALPIQAGDRKGV